MKISRKMSLISVFVDLVKCVQREEALGNLHDMSGLKFETMLPKDILIIITIM